MKVRRALGAFAGAVLFVQAGCAPIGTGPTASSAADLERRRVIVLTDIGNEPDDSQSLIRFLLYTNEFDVEGLVATTSVFQRNRVQPAMIRERVEAYRQVRENLRVHADGYPTADFLLGVTKAGRAAYGMAGVGSEMSTEASNHIIDVVDEADRRPVWVLIWGGALDLAQALWDVRESRTPQEVAEFVANLRVYEIAGQDDAGAWAVRTFPDLFWIRNATQFHGISRRVDNPEKWAEARGGNEAVIEPEWTKVHIQSHGPLGALYPDTKYKTEGDTPSFLYLIPNGLSDPARPDQGGWGGRFTVERQRSPRPPNFPAKVPAEYEPYFMMSDAADTWSYEDATYAENRFAPLFRWREAVQNDFAARMDWSVTPWFDEANHNPVAALNGAVGRETVHLEARSGERVRLTAEGSSDPDDDALTYHWFHYPEPGSYTGTLRIDGDRRPAASFVAPDVDEQAIVHVILEVRDTASPRLSSYRRAVVTIRP